MIGQVMAQMRLDILPWALMKGFIRIRCKRLTFTNQFLDKMTKKTKEPKVELELKTFEEQEVKKEQTEEEAEKLKNTPMNWSKPNGGK